MSETAPDAAPNPPKEDPEGLVLRGRARPVVRFRRGLVIGLAAAAALGIAAVAWMALEPPSFELASSGPGAAERRSDGAPEALAGAPQSYGDVPQLGPPLPGDLGGPILEHQRNIDNPPDVAVLSAADARRAAAEAERQRRAAELAAAHSSGLIVQLSERADTPGVRPRGSGGDPRVSVGGETGNAAAPAPTERRDANATSLQPSPSPWTLTAGTVIPASLLTGLNSDLPGTVVAQVTANVRDSATGRTVLIPQGSRLIGSYDAVAAYGQRRALLVWQRIVLPDGASLTLDNVPATDLAGYSGVEDGVDFHTWRLLKGIGLSTLLGVGTEIGLGKDEGDLVRAVRESSQQNAARTGDQITARNLDVRPTITVRPGWPVRAIVNKDLVLQPWRP